MSRRLWPAAVCIWLAAAACAPGSTGAARLTPLAHTTASPSASPSPIAPLRISTAPFHAGELAFAYTPVTLRATGGVAPYRWSLGGGALPIGLSLSEGGRVTGTPSATGSFLFSVRVDDTAGGSTSVNSSIGVTKHLTVTGICTPAAPCSVEAGCVTVCGVFGVQSGGVSPIKYRVTTGVLPTGMGLGPFALTKAFPAPGAAGHSWLFTVTATDAVGATAKTTASFHVFPHIAFTTAAATCAMTPTGCSVQLSYTLGTPNLQTPGTRVTVAGVGPLPVAHASAASGTVNVTVAYVRCPAAGKTTWTVTVILTDSSPCAANTYCASRPVKLTVTC